MRSPVKEPGPMPTATPRRAERSTPAKESAPSICERSVSECVRPASTVTSACSFPSLATATLDTELAVSIARIDNVPHLLKKFLELHSHKRKTQPTAIRRLL